MSEPGDADFSLLLWLLGLFVAGLAWHLSNGWLRMAQGGAPTLRSHWRALALSAAALGTGLNAAFVLGLEAQPLAFPFGFHALGALGLVFVGFLLCVPVVALPAAARQSWRLLLSGALLAAVALGLQAGWVMAAGFRPGVLWRPEVLAAAALVLLVGLTMARWVAFSEATEASPRRVAWRGAAAVLAAVTLMAAQQLVGVAAGLSAQRGSLFESHLHGTVLGLLCGVLVPLVMAAMVLDLWLRRQQRPRRGEPGLALKKRRKRRQRMRTL